MTGRGSGSGVSRTALAGTAIGALAGLGAMAAAVLLYAVFTHRAGGWKPYGPGFWIVAGPVVLLVLSPYWRLARMPRRSEPTARQASAAALIVVAGLWLEFVAYDDYGHGAPVFLLAAPVTQHVLLLVLGRLARPRSDSRPATADVRLPPQGSAPSVTDHDSEDMP